MRLGFTILIGCLLCMTFQLSAQTKPTEAIHWLSFEQLSDSLAVKPKPVLLFFHTDWCAYCRKMQNEVFTDNAVIKAIQKDYYAVQFDAESSDTIYFDQQPLTNPHPRKQTGKYHSITQLLAAREGKYAFPCTILLDTDFRIKQRYFQYLSPEKLLRALK